MRTKKNLSQNLKIVIGGCEAECSVRHSLNSPYIWTILSAIILTLKSVGWDVKCSSLSRTHNPLDTLKIVFLMLYWLIIHSIISRSGFFHLNRNVTIAGERNKKFGPILGAQGLWVPVRIRDRSSTSPEREPVRIKVRVNPPHPQSPWGSWLE
jgi:hypothetical protein